MEWARQVGLMHSTAAAASGAARSLTVQRPCRPVNGAVTNCLCMYAYKMFEGITCTCWGKSYTQEWA